MIDLTNMILSASDDPQDWAEISDVARDEGLNDGYIHAISESVCVSQWFRAHAEKYRIHPLCNAIYKRSRTHPSPSSADAWVWRFHHSPGHGEDQWSAVTIPARAWYVLDAMDDLRRKKKEIPTHALAWISRVMLPGEYKIQGLGERWIVARPKKLAQVGREILRQAPPSSTIVV